MAVRIYGDYQTAGVSITTTGKGAPSNDGLTAYAQAFVQYDGSGNLVPIPTATTPSFVTAGSPTTTTATILNTQSLSAGVQVTGKLVGIIIPAAWTAAAITFQGGQTLGGTYFDIWDGASGTAAERTIPSANVVASRFYPLSLNDWLAVNYIKIRSGTSATPVVQGADRVFTLVMAG